MPAPDLSELPLEDLVVRLVRTKASAFRGLDRAEKILCDHLLKRMKVGQRVNVGRRIYELVDNFAEGNTTYRAKQFSRLEIKDVTPKPKKIGAKK